MWWTAQKLNITVKSTLFFILFSIADLVCSLSVSLETDEFFIALSTRFFLFFLEKKSKHSHLTFYLGSLRS